MKLTMLGTGNALVTECYNACFALTEGKDSFLIDTGGGNGILNRLKNADIDLENVRDIFITHKHIDHFLGIVWIVRMIGKMTGEGKWKGEYRFYAHEEVMELLKGIAAALLQEKDAACLGRQIRLITLKDGQEEKILGRRVVFFDTHSTKAKQFGFTMYLNGTERFTCCGDELFNETEERYARKSKWLLHEAFCLDREKERFHPYKSCHSTVKDACLAGEELGVENLVLYHTEDKNLARRKRLYMEEGRMYFSGNLYIPDDLEELEL